MSMNKREYAEAIIRVIYGEKGSLLHSRRHSMYVKLIDMKESELSDFYKEVTVMRNFIDSAKSFMHHLVLGKTGIEVYHEPR